MYEPIKNIPEEKLNYILYGTNELLEFNYVSKNGNTRNTKGTYEGVIPSLERRYVETKSGWIREWLQGYMIETECPVCKGKRLQNQYYQFTSIIKISLICVICLSVTYLILLKN